MKRLPAAVALATVAPAATVIVGIVVVVSNVGGLQFKILANCLKSSFKVVIIVKAQLELMITVTTNTITAIHNNNSLMFWIEYCFNLIVSNYVLM